MSDDNTQDTATYTLSLAGVTPASGPEQPQSAVESDEERAAAEDLGNISELDEVMFPRHALEGQVGERGWFRFTLTEAKMVGLGLRQQDANADLYLEDADGNVLYSSTSSGTANEWVRATLLAGTYYVRVEAQEAGRNEYVFRYGVAAPDPDEVARLEQLQQGNTNEAPSFGAASYAFELAENSDGSTTGVALGTVSATDADSDTVTYSIEGGNSAGLFEIDSSTGALSYKGTGEDYESDTTSYELTVRASDGSLHSDLTVTVNVTDVAEAPTFAEASYAFELAENSDGSTTGVALGTVSATDADSDTVTYSIEGGNSAGLFEIDSSTGALSYKGTGEDYESDTTSYELTVRASDGSLHSDVTVTVNVTDEEEQPQSLTQNLADSDAAREGATDLGDITALDGARFPRNSLDGDDDRIDYYRFTLTEAKGIGLGLRQQDANADLFLEDAEGNVLHSSTEAGTANDAIWETLLAGTYYVRVETQEAGQNDHVFRYGVRDADAEAVRELERQQQEESAGEAPAFAEASYAFDLAENADGSTSRVSLGTVSATDPEGAQLTYSIEAGNDAGLFEIDAATGALSYGGSGEDYESDTTSYELTVRASDGSLHDDTSVTVNVTDVDESPTPPQSVSEPDGDDLPADTSTAGRVAVGSNATGDIGTTGDRDWFAVEFEAGRAYLIQLEGRQKGLGTLRDPYLHAIYDQNGEWIPDTSDNDNGAGLDSRLIYRATETATHFIAARSDRASSLHGPPHGTYQLSVTLIPDDFTDNTDTTGAVRTDGRYTRGVLEYSADVDWFAVQLEAGTRYRVDVRGAGVDYGGTLPNPVMVVYDSSGDALVSDDNTGTGNNARLTGFVPETDGTYYIGVNGRGGVGAYRVFVTGVPVDPDDDFTQSATGSGTVDVDGSVTGDIEADFDHDWFAVELEAHKTYRIKLEGSPTDRGTLIDPYLWGIYTGGEEQNENLIANTFDDDSGTGRNSEVLYTPTTAGTYYISAGAYEKYRPVTGTYRLSVDEVEDDYLGATGTTGTVTVDSNTTGNIQFTNDRDWFAVEFEAGHAYRIKLEGSPTWQGTLSDPYLHGIYDQNGDRIANTSDDDSGVGNNSQLVYVATASGTHYIAAGGYVSGDYASKGTYRLYVTDIVDDFGADTGTTGTVAVDGSVTGEVQYPREHDWFAVELEADTPYVIRVEGREARQGTLFDPYLHGIYDQNGDLIPDTSDDDGGDGTTSELLFETPTAGTYYISAGGNHSWLGTYRLSVTTFDDDFDADTDTTGVVTVGGNVTGDIQLISDVDWFAVEFVAGTRYRIRMEASSTDDGTLYDPYLRGIYDEDGELIEGTSIDDGGVGRNSELNYVAAVSGTHYIAASGDWGTMGTYELSVRAYTDDFGADTNTAGAVTVGGSTTGRLNHDGDRDWFAVTLEAAKTYRIDVKGDTTADSGGTLDDPALVMHDSSGDAIDQAADDNSGVGLNARLADFSPDTDGTYYIEVNDPGGLGTYTVAVQEAEDSI